MEELNCWSLKSCDVWSQLSNCLLPSPSEFRAEQSHPSLWTTEVHGAFSHHDRPHLPGLLFLFPTQVNTFITDWPTDNRPFDGFFFLLQAPTDNSTFYSNLRFLSLHRSEVWNARFQTPWNDFPHDSPQILLHNTSPDGAGGGGHYRHRAEIGWRKWRGPVQSSPM